MPTLGQLSKERLSVELNNASTVLYTSTRRQQAINDAAEEFADLTECLVRQATITLSCSVREYTLLSSGVLSGSTDYSRISSQGVEYLFTDSNGLVTQLAGDDFVRRDIHLQNRAEPGWRGSTTPVRSPTAYYIRPSGGDLLIGLFEPPRVGSSETAVLQVPYVARPAPMGSTSDLPFTVNSTVRTDLTIYHRALPHYAAHKLLPLTGDQQGAIAQLQLFQSYVQRYKGDQRPKGGQSVTFATDYLSRARGSDADDWRRVPGWTWR
jgi:hypothetical protein